jgi:diaminohydroxyphosphoribosylaminopyrimidine deaminase / 5-amino-6-(5-phosphoribosylamino)uracil reductase
MRRALELARLGRGRVHPNPLVGAVLVRDGHIIGEGAHREYGGPHAEVDALRSAGEAARGATLYVTLEPCTHHGKTPPCSAAILAAGIARLVYAASDPDARARGGGRRLREAGVDVVEGVERKAARALNAQFFHLRERGAPYLALKLALSLDGGIAAAPGERTQLTGSEAVLEAHRLRAEHDAILVGSRTAFTDDPLLTVRGVTCRHPPVRIVVDSEARLSPGSRLVTTLGQAPVWLLCAADAPAAGTRSLAAAGVRILPVPRDGRRLDTRGIRDVLAAEGLRSILVEGGGAIASSLLSAGLLDRMYLFVAPCFLGPRAVRGLQPHADAGNWEYTASERFGADLLLTLDPAQPAESS